MALDSRSTRRWTALIVSAPAILGLAVVAAAPARATDASLYAPTSLVLTIAQGEDAQPVQRAATLRCAPRGGDHPTPGAACRALAPVKGDFTAMRPRSGYCTMEYRPVTVTATGVWRGSLVSHRKTYGNSCTLRLATGPVFAF